jgi:hypothetical protein
MKFRERKWKKFRKISRNFCDEISRNQIHFRTYYVFREIKKIDFRDHPSGISSTNQASLYVQDRLASEQMV